MKRRGRTIRPYEPCASRDQECRSPAEGAIFDSRDVGSIQELALDVLCMGARRGSALPKLTEDGEEERRMPGDGAVERSEVPASVLPADPDSAKPILDLLPVAVYFCDRAGQIVQYNRAASHLWGREPRLNDPQDRFCGSHRLRLLDGTVLPHEKCPMATALESGIAARDLEVMIERPDGSLIVAQANIEPFRDATGAVAGAVNCLQDVTERHRLHAELQERERHYHALIDALPAAVYTTDARGRITYFNEAAAALWGRRPTSGIDEICGSWRLYSADGRPIAPDECPMGIALRERRAIRGAEAAAERPDGTRVPFLAYPTPLMDENGVMIGAVNTLIDITERKIEEKKLRDSEKRFRRVFNHCNDAIFIINPAKDAIVDVNRRACGMLGYTREELLALSISAVHPKEIAAIQAFAERVVAEGEGWTDDLTCLTKSGETIPCEISASAVEMAGTTYLIALVRDIRDRKRAQEQQVLLLREMSHRVKNLFSITMGIVNMSARSAASAAELAEKIRGRLMALARAHELTMADSIGRGTARPIGLRALIKLIASPYNADGEERIMIAGDVEASIDGSAVTPVALMLHELATNAAKHGCLSATCGRVNLAWSLKDDRLHLTWKERGGPIVAQPPEKDGFGSYLATSAVGQLDGEIMRDWQPEGLLVSISVPRKWLVA